MKRNTFDSRFGAMMAMVGAAVGLGNIWNFPYLAGQNGGGAFVLLYLCCVLLIGVPLLITTIALGRNGGKNVFGSYKKFIPDSRVHYFGIFVILCVVLITSFYTTVAAWAIEYLKLFITNSFSGLNKSQIKDLYEGFICDPIKPVLLQFLFVLIAGAFVLLGVRRGIEKSSKVIMPLFFIVLTILFVKSCFLPTASDAWYFMFYPEFSQLDSNSIFDALGQCFFSLSIGMGVMLTYGSYLNKEDHLVKFGANVAIIDTLVAIVAGITIFPTAFNYGMTSNDGIGMFFEALPYVLNGIDLGFLWGILFFVLVLFAALTSAVSFMEVIVAFLVQEFNYTRKRSTIYVVILISILGFLCTFSFGPFCDCTFFNKNLYEFFYFISINIFLPISGLFMCALAGWIMDEDVLKNELTNGGQIKFKFFKLYIFFIRYVIPPFIFFILLDGLGVFL